MIALRGRTKPSGPARAICVASVWRLVEAERPAHGRAMPALVPDRDATDEHGRARFELYLTQPRASACPAAAPVSYRPTSTI